MSITEYVSTPRTTDPAELLAEKNLAIAWLRGIIAQRDAEIQERERYIGELLREIAGL